MVIHSHHMASPIYKQQQVTCTMQYNDTITWLLQSTNNNRLHGYAVYRYK